MFVIKRDGRRQDVHFDKITARITRLSYGLNTDFCDPVKVAQKVAAGVYRGVTATELDELAAETAASLTSTHPDYGVLAARIAVSNLHKNTVKSFVETIKAMHGYVNKKNGNPSPLVSDEVFVIVVENAELLDNEIRYDRDFDYDYFGFKTLERSYLLRIDSKIVERPQHMLMRVSIGIHGRDVTSAIKTYHLMSDRWFTHASPTLFNSGTPHPQMSSCFLVNTKSDSIEGIYDTLKECAVISKNAGGIGISIHDVRATGSYISGTNGASNGITPMLRVFNDTARYVDQGGGKRKGAFAVYIEPWHADIFEWLDLRKNHGKEETRARDLFFGLWIGDLFMRRVEANTTWSLFCPHEAPGLSDCWGPAFDALYEKYEATGRVRKVIRAQELWFAILEAQIETGTPYMLYKDACNSKSNQQNLGTIKSSNLCVAPETKILTRAGDVTIRECVDRSVDVWNGEEFSAVIVHQTGINQPVLTVRFSNGARLDCTPYHKFFVQDAGVTTAQTLRPGDHITKFKLPQGDEVDVFVESVEDTGRTDDTYCFTEPLRGKGVFNGILTGQCTEIIEFTSPEETAVCNLASLALPRFVVDTASSRKIVGSLGSPSRTFDYQKLAEVTAVATRNLNKIIDRNFYPVETARRSNLRHRPIGIGVQGLADAFILMGLPFDGTEAKAMNAKIFECMYFAALSASCDLAAADGPYETYEGSPVSKGVLQHDMWGVPDSPDFQWAELRLKIKEFGVRNSLLLAPMPTASTSQILGNNEAFEPYTSNIYTRRVLSGEFTIINNHLMSDLVSLGIWNAKTKNELIVANGSVQGIDMPAQLKALYKTVWEIKQRVLVDMAADRGAFIDQSQSFNVFIADPDFPKLTSLHFYTWKKGLKTGMYYLRTRPAADAIKFTVDACTLENKNGCTMCGS